MKHSGWLEDPSQCVFECFSFLGFPIQHQQLEVTLFLEKTSKGGFHCHIAGVPSLRSTEKGICKTSFLKGDWSK